MNADSDNCPACTSHQADEVECVNAEALSAGYRNSTINVDIARLLPEGLHRIRLLRCQACDLQWFSPSIEGDPEFYEALQAIPWYYEDNKPEHVHALGLLKPGGPLQRVLEVGCGRGAFGALVANTACFRGLEFNQRAVDAARAQGLDVVRRPIAEEAAEFPAGYDTVCHFQVLEHVHDVKGFMQGCVDALRPGGLLLTCVPANDSFAALAASSWLNMPPHHLTRWSDRALHSLYARLGLEQIELWHEPVAAVHREWYAITMTRVGLHALFGRTLPSSGDGLLLRTADRLGRVKAMRRALVRIGEGRSGIAGRGHSVVAIGRKPVS